ncbi:MAG: hypothetical protein L3J76_04225 [Candidatus Hydrothermae bacterium]|nr:hypothetical protein [Candidatus Hydrothermae bacterium]
MNDVFLFWISGLTVMMVLGFVDIHRRLRTLERRMTRGSGLVFLLQVVHVGLSGGLQKREIVRVIQNAENEHEALKLLVSYMRGRVDNPEVLKFTDAVDIVSEFFK